MTSVQISHDAHAMSSRNSYGVGTLTLRSSCIRLSNVKTIKFLLWAPNTKGCCSYSIVCVWPLIRYAILSVVSSLATISLSNSELVTLLLPCDYKCSASLPRGAVGWSA